MPNPDHDKLRELAEAAIKKGPRDWYGPATDAFHDEIGPEGVLSLLDRIATLERALAPFAKIRPTSFSAADGSEAEPYEVHVSLNAHVDFTGADLARARAAFPTCSRPEAP
jgi:hypothetical protein